MSLSTDLRLALRSLSRHRLVTAAAMATLTLGVTANSAVFALLYGALLRPLPFEEPHRLVYLQGIDPESPSADWGIFPELFDELEAHSFSGFQGLAAMVADADLAFHVQVSSGNPARARGAAVSSNFFQLLGVEAASGRIFESDEELPTNSDVAIISDRLWRSQFGADSTVLGRTIRLNDFPFTIIGVMPRDFAYPSGVDIWVPRPQRSPRLRNVAVFVQANFQAIARLAPGTSMAAAEEELRAFYGSLRERYPERAFIAQDLRVRSLKDSLVGNAHRPMVLLQVGVAAVFLICCANVGGLLLVRWSRRRRELAVRSALGAKPRDLLRQVLVELAVLFFVGALLSLLMSSWVLDLLVTVAPSTWTAYADVHSDEVTAFFTLTVALICAGVTGLLPMAAALRPDLMKPLKSTSLGGSRQGARWARVLVIGEVALAVGLTVGAGLVTRTLLELQARDLGFSGRNVLTVRITLLESRHPDPADRTRWFAGLQRALAEIPGVEAVGASQSFFVTEGVRQSFLANWDGAEENSDTPRLTSVAYITPGYFKALRIPLLAGQLLHDRALESQAPEAVITRSFAQELWPGEYPLGRRIQIERQSWRVVGVVGDLVSPRLNDDSAPEIFVPHALGRLRRGEMTYLIHAPAAVPGLAAAVRAQIRAFDPSQAHGPVIPLQGVLDREIGPQRYSSLLLSVFSALALLLAAIGIYGVGSSAVSQRTTEFGARMAMGATGKRILFEVLWSSARLGVVGVAVGGLLGYLFGRGLGSLIFGIPIWEPRVWSVALALGLSIPVIAGLGPARRASRVGPAAALREL